MSRIKSFIGQLWSSEPKREDPVLEVSDPNGDANTPQQQESPILRNNYLYAPLPNQRLVKFAAYLASVTALEATLQSACQLFLSLYCVSLVLHFNENTAKTSIIHPLGTFSISSQKPEA